MNLPAAPIDVTALLRTILALARQKTVVCVAIDGVGGAGKSSLALRLRDGLPGSVIIQMDDFYAPALAAPDRLRLREQVLLPLHEGREARYQVYDWKTGRLLDRQVLQPSGIFIFEGVYALDRQLRDLYDLKIWIDCPPEWGFRRGVARDLARDGVDNSAQWQKLWMPLEAQYRAEQEPERCADFRLDGEGEENRE